MTSTQIRRSENDVGSIFRWELTKPASDSDSLALAELRKRDVDIAHVDVDHMLTGLYRCLARHIPGGLAMAHDKQSIGPDLIRFHVVPEVKERTI